MWNLIQTHIVINITMQILTEQVEKQLHVLEKK